MVELNKFLQVVEKSDFSLAITSTYLKSVALLEGLSNVFYSIINNRKVETFFAVFTLFVCFYFLDKITQK